VTPLSRTRRDDGTVRYGQYGWLSFPLIAFHAVFFLGSQAVFLHQAFYRSAGWARVDYGQRTLSNLATVVTDDFHRAVVLDTLLFAALVVAACLLLGYPLSYAIARSGRIGAALLVIVVASSFSGTVTRILGWQVILGDTGPVNWLLVAAGLASAPIRLVNNMTGAVIGTAQVMLPFMVLTLVPVIEQIHPSLEEAASGLGASWWRTWWSVTLPLSLGGGVGGSLLVFAVTAGSFTTPALLGGGKTHVLPVVINDQMRVALNYPRAAAMSLVLLVIVLTVAYFTDLLTRSRRVVSP
jgi:ABC-type spermidine/putrescine transport system permease subunit I